MKGFWSYVHKDDAADNRRIAQLARDVEAQYEMLTGESIETFLDRDILEWGDNWRHKIDKGLAVVAFFIPVITPRYFSSAECRRELNTFARRTQELGIKELLLPLLYVDYAPLHDKDSDDDLVSLVKSYQWEDWRELRFAELTSREYRRGVSRLASRLVIANRLVEQPVNRNRESDQNDDEEKTPGLIDRLAGLEEALPRAGESIVGITGQIERIGLIVSNATSEIHPSTPFAERREVIGKVARELEVPTEEIWRAANEFSSQLHDIDDGFRALVEQFSDEAQTNPESVNHTVSFFDSVRHLASASQTAFGSIERLMESTIPAERLSREIRPVLRRLRQGLTVFADGKGVIESWVDLINAPQSRNEQPHEAKQLR